MEAARIDVWPKVMARDAGRSLDLKHVLGREAATLQQELMDVARRATANLRYCALRASSRDREIKSLERSEMLSVHDSKAYSQLYAESIGDCYRWLSKP